MAYRGEIKAARLRGLVNIPGFQTRKKYIENEYPGRGFVGGFIKRFRFGALPLLRVNLIIVLRLCGKSVFSGVLTLNFSLIRLYCMNSNIIQMVPADHISFLLGMYQWGIEIIKMIQRIESPFMTGLAKFITALGTESLYVPLILLIFWWIDEKQGLRFGILIILTAWINAFLKVVFKQPRPYNLDPSVGLAYETSYGVPSGHAQMSLTFWVSTAVWLSHTWASPKQGESGHKSKKILVWAVAVLLILLIGLSRLYLGVHFPTDLFAGWVIAALVLVIWLIYGPALEKFFISVGVRSQNITVAVLALVMNGVYPRDRTLPALFLGFCIGYTLMRKYFPFSARGEINGKKPGVLVFVFRCVLGFLGMVIIYAVLRLIFPGDGSLFGNIPGWGQSSPFYEIGHFIRYGLVGMWASAGAPRMFQQMGLAAVTGGAGSDKNTGDVAAGPAAGKAADSADDDSGEKSQR